MKNQKLKNNISDHSEPRKNNSGSSRKRPKGNQCPYSITKSLGPNNPHLDSYQKLEDRWKQLNKAPHSDPLHTLKTSDCIAAAQSRRSLGVGGSQTRNEIHTLKVSLQPQFKLDPSPRLVFNKYHLPPIQEQPIYQNTAINMYLREVIATGFKSFADRTSIEMGPGVTTVVGPNGCGKSNIVDAIRWVLGEQSAKALRGAKMHDVIFAGTDSRPPHHQCEVTLIFTDCEKELGTAYNEVEITRRVTREGASNYYINGKSARLKDIQQLFMDTGIGRVSYSFMVQGQIDQILSNNPAERRVIFEEAAGITRYKAQRREALLKLSQVDQNLSRVTDVIEEVGRQMGTLKRQAAKALRYKRVQHRLSHLDLAMSAHQFRKLQVTLSDLKEKTAHYESTVSTLQTALESKETALEETKAERASLYEHLQALQSQAYELRSKKDQLENQAELATIRMSDANSRIEQIHGELESLSAQITELVSKARDDSHIKQLQLDLVETSNTAHAAKEEELSAIQAALSAEELTLQNKKRELASTEGATNRLRAKLTDWQVRLQTNAAKVEDLTTRKSEAEAQQADLATAVSKATEEVTTFEKNQATAQSELEQAQQTAAQTRDTFRAAQSALQEQDRATARTQAQFNILEGLQQKFEGFSDGAKALLQGKLSSVTPTESLSILTQDITVQDGFAEPLERLMGQAADAVALDSIASVTPLTQELATQNLGQACLQVHTPGSGLNFSTPDNLPDSITPAQTTVASSDTDRKERWHNLLNGCYFAQNLDEFIAYWQENPNFQFLYATTLEDNALIDARGLIYGGSSSSKSADASFIERESQIRDLEKSLSQDKAKLQTLTTEAESASEKFDQAETTVESKRKALTEASHELNAARLQLREAQSNEQRNTDTLERTLSQLDSLNQNHGDTESSVTSAESELSEESSRLTQLKEEITFTEESIHKIREQRDAHREALSELRIDLAEKRQRLDLLDQGLNEVESRKLQITQTQEKRKAEIDRLKDSISELKSESEQATAEAAEVEKAHAERLEALEKQKTGLIAIEEQITTAENALSKERKELHEQEDHLKNCEIKLSSEQSQATFLREKARSEHDIEIDAINWRLELWKADEPFETKLKLDDIDDAKDLETPKVKHDRGDPTEEDLEELGKNADWAEIDKELQALRSKIASMGAVNLVAIEEYIELKERFEFLNTQCNDLTLAKEELVEAIDEINSTSQKLFAETFEKVRENFKFTFDALFGGGFADLQLIENEEDILDSGIDIIARPPGTKMKTLTLLSGGQKTMTAVALLFAIYKVKPSPFCVLDELDAPLDDANIGRFTAMLREFTKYSQFLVISHNKRTIAASDRLYGVTMQEKGVTRLISMQFKKEDEKGQENAEAELALAEGGG